MFQAMERLHSLSGVRPAFYMSRDLITGLRQQTAKAVASSTLTVENVGGVRTRMFQEVPVRRCDALAVDETAVA